MKTADPNIGHTESTSPLALSKVFDKQWALSWAWPYLHLVMIPLKTEYNKSYLGVYVVFRITRNLKLIRSLCKHTASDKGFQHLWSLVSLGDGRGIVGPVPDRHPGRVFLNCPPLENLHLWFWLLPSFPVCVVNLCLILLLFDWIDFAFQSSFRFIWK